MRSVWWVVLAACGGPQGAGEIGTNRVKVEWRTTPADPGTVAVVLVVDGEIQAQATLSTAADPGANGTCRVRKADVIATELVCGATSTYNYVAAELKAGQVIVTQISGLNDNPNAEERKVVARIPVAGTAFTVLPFTPTSP